MNTKYNAAALAFALLATSSVAMNADNTSSAPVLTAKAAAVEDVKAVNPVKNEFYRLFRVRKTFIAFKDGIVWKLADNIKLAEINIKNPKIRVYKAGEAVALNSKGYDRYGFDLKPYLNNLIALKAAK